MNNINNNPKTAPFVPIKFSIEVEKDIDDDLYYGVEGLKKTTTTLIFKGWDRKGDSVLTYTATLTGQDQVILMESNLELDDIEWLKNIGARE